jgi:predicted MFS family arabinose efflux permease
MFFILINQRIQIIFTMVRKDSYSLVNTLSVTGALISAQQQMVNPLLGIYVNEYLNVTPSLVGYVFTLFSLSALLTKFFNFLISRNEKVIRIMFVFGLFVNSIAPVGYAFTNDYSTLLFLRIVHGVAFAYDTVLMLTIAGHENGRNDVSRAIYRYTTFLALGLTAGPVAGTMSVMAFGVKNTILVSAFLGTCALVIGYGVEKHIPKVEKTEITMSIRSMARQLSNGPLLTAAAAYLSYNIAYGAVLAYSPLIARKEIGLSENIVTVLFLVYYSSALISRAILSRLLPKFKIYVFYAVILAVSAAGTFLIATVRSPVLFSVGYFIMAVGHGTTFPLSSLIVATRYGDSLVRLVANSVVMSMWDAGMMLGPIISSLFLIFMPLDMVLGPMVFFPIAGCLGLLTRAVGGGRHGSTTDR